MGVTPLEFRGDFWHHKTRFPALSHGVICYLFYLLYQVLAFDVNLIAKLAGTSWGASASTLRTSALTLCYSVAEYCCPVWARSSYTNLIDTQLHSSMRLISGCLKPTQLPWLPVLRNVAPPSLRRTAATDKIQVSSKITQIGLCILMSLSIHLHGLHLDVQYGQT